MRDEVNIMEQSSWLYMKRQDLSVFQKRMSLFFMFRTIYPCILVKLMDRRKKRRSMNERIFI